MTEIMQGIPASPGIALGEVLVLKEEKLIVPKKLNVNKDEELGRFSVAVTEAIREIEKIKKQALKKMGAEQALIFESHSMMLEDPELQEQVKKNIREQSLSAEEAVQKVAEHYVAMFESMDSAYMRARAIDIKDVTDRVLRILLGISSVDLSSLPKKVVLVAEDLTPSHAVTMDKDNVIGFLTNIGGVTSHTAILARTLEVPAIVGLKVATEHLKTGQRVAFDGEQGTVLSDPSQDELQKFIQKQKDFLRKKEELYSLKSLPSETLDGHKVKLLANIGTHEDLPALDRNDAEGVGLFRTEFIYLNRNSAPTEDEQFQIYKKVISHMHPRRTIIRTMDIGGDKQVPYFQGMSGEQNPFLGLRAIRFCLQNTDLFKTQLRAILRASHLGKVGIMFPMISQLQELLDAKKLFEECKEELIKEGVTLGHNIKLGIMIEVPSAALMSDILGRNCDFFSIGTNDLIQYTCAVDRMNEKIKHLYTPFHPSVLRLIHMVIQNGKKNNIPVGMCGEMAGDRRFIPLLLGMGLDDFSMSPLSILPARKLVRSLRHTECRELVKKVVNVERSSEAIGLLDNFLTERNL